MAYTASTNRQSTPFGGSVTDANRVAMTGFGNSIQTIDATGTPQASPLVVNTTATLVVPLNAIRCTISSVTNSVQVSEDSTQSAYFTVPAATLFTIDCARQTNIYLKTGSSTAVNFYFSLV
jgi:hypothetical protein